MLLLLLFSLNLSQHPMIIFQVDFLSSAKAGGKENCFDVPWEVVIGGTIPQDPRSQLGRAGACWTQCMVTVRVLQPPHPLHSPRKSAPTSTLPSSSQALCEPRCPNDRSGSARSGSGAPWTGGWQPFRGHSCTMIHMSPRVGLGRVTEGLDPTEIL